MADPAKPGSTREAEPGVISTDVPARLDRLPWSRWHWRIVIGLGTVWILDGLEVTIVGNMAGRLAQHGSGISISTAQVTTVAAAVYVAGACSGALFFGWLTDRLGRKKLFMLTLAVYLAATAVTSLSWTAWFFFLCRFFTGFGIGGEYAAINSAIDELIPARVRGRIDLVINGSFWVGAAFGAFASIALLNTSLFATAVGWRLAFGIGVVLGLVILLVRRHVPESPRWLFTHGRADEAEQIVAEAERTVERQTGAPLPPVEEAPIRIRAREPLGFVAIARTVVSRYPRRTALGFALFVGQAFLYNAVTFGYATILTTYFAVPEGHTGYYFAVIAVGNFLGPLLLGHLFDSLGRKPMIAGTYIGSGVLLFATAALFQHGSLSAATLTGCWTAVLFLASAGASSAYLTVSEIFPLETRALCIAFFYAVGTAVGGISGPLLFNGLVSSGKVSDTTLAFCIGAGLMTVAGLVEAAIGVKAERRSLESLAAPLSAVRTEA
ncbi:MFS transporter [Kitasatospora aureofaciens]|uniref:MFS transporter n=1 Tax=Kitasatospora aureofaciens TaxID=1894 RepID=A0A1E7NF91_KITAU|nr:MFS transporter [Kitasatospora aureofaciens]OEV39342.1 MFS transporter [Kitasatospora aureofaciens]QEV03251.1 MFS transporter [Streptomyces viridifaciens]UKZ09925.1 MFS transporter [Streptomyces viridifaciens]